MAVPAAQSPPKDNKLLKYLREVRAEVRKVQWPNRRELIAFTQVTLVTVFIVALAIFLIDVVFTQVLNLVTR